ncbi:cytochrome B [Chryseosolibacter indicus]|uniref:Cytochrome B n=1 Tax=Chryseosolibacter indicus TaxID=2782351 RepID=A0ABS5VPF2_9BACT|nr:cytochrome B [Chryseosolibacter indicus]MBT1703221.1 cytochrome B [Chryseosolibacter indicus]
MYSGLLVTHSYLRYFILIMLIIVIVMSLIGLVNKKPYTKTHDKTGLFLFICTHIQLLLGIILYIVSYTSGGRVQFNSETMKNAALRYFAVEHGLTMLIAVVFITLARTGAKKLAVDQAKHRRLFIFNLIALIIIIGTVYGLGGGYNTY